MSRMFGLAVCSAWMAVMLQAQTVADDEADWPRFRGPDGRGVGRDEKPLPVDFGPAKNMRWKTPVLRGHSSPCISKGRIFLTGFDDRRGELETICLDKVTGTLLWRRSAPAVKVERVHEVGSPAAPTPASDGERVYVYFGSYGILCYDLDGKEQWKLPLDTPDVLFGTGASPIVAENLVLLNVDQNRGSYLLAVDRRTGQQVWKQARPLFGRGWATPLHVRRKGVSEVVVLGSRRLVGYGLIDGAERWSVGGLPPFTISSPTLGEGFLFLAATDESGEPENVVQPPSFDDFIKQNDENRDGKVGRDEVPPDFAVVSRRASGGAGDTKLQSGYFTSLDLDKDSTLNREEWTKFATRMSQWPMEFHCVVVALRLGDQSEVTQTQIVWRAADGVPEVPSPLVYQDRIYTVKNSGIVFCRDAKGGQVIYKGRLGASGGYYASPIAGDGKIYFASDRGVIVVIKAGDHFEVLARNDFEEPIMATPAIVDGQLYVRTEMHVYAFSK